MDRAVMLERRRRTQLIRRRRRDLLADTAIAIALTMFALIVTGGLGVLALIEVPVALGLVATVVLERRRRRLGSARSTAKLRPGRD